MRSNRVKQYMYIYNKHLCIVSGKSSDAGPDRLGAFPFPLISPYPYPNGATVPGFVSTLLFYNKFTFQAFLFFWSIYDITCQLGYSYGSFFSLI